MSETKNDRKKEKSEWMENLLLREHSGQEK